MVDNADGDTETITMTDTFTRFIPYYQSRSPITNEGSLGSNPSDTPFNAMTGITTISGTGLLYLAADATQLAANLLFVTNGQFPLQITDTGTTFNVNQGNGDAITYRVYTIPIIGSPVTLTNFRATAF